MKNLGKIVNLSDWCPCLNPFDKINWEIIKQFDEKYENLPCYIFFERAKSPCVKCTGDLENSKVMIIGQNPGKTEDDKGICFVGRSGQKLVEVLEELGFKRKDFYITNALKCYAETEEIKQRQIKVCSFAILRRELKVFNGNKIICLGNIAFQGLQYALLGKIEYKFEKGKVFDLHSPILQKTFTVCLTYHPSYILTHPHYEPIFIKDMKKFLIEENKQEINYTLLDNYEKIKNFFDFINNNNNDKNRILAIDLETYSKDMLDYKNNGIFCIGIATDKENGYCIPLYHYDLMKKKIISYYVEPELKKIINLLKEQFENNFYFIGHNIAFDCIVLKNFLNIDIRERICGDTMVMHHLINENLPHDLKTLVDIYTPLKNYYQEMKETFRSGKKWYEEVNFDELFKYCAYDCCAVWYLYEKFNEEIEKIDKKQKEIRIKLNEKRERLRQIDIRQKILHPLDTYCGLKKLNEITHKHYKVLILMMQTGLPFSKSYIEKIDKEIFNEIKRKEKELNELAGVNINWKSSKQISETFKKLGIDSPIKTAKGNPSYNEEALKILAEKGIELAQKLLEYRELVKAYTTYVKMIEKYNYRLIETEDNDIFRLACRININGTETGRLSTSEPCLHQIPRNNLYRNMVVARDGWLIVSADYSMADLRMLAGYSCCQSMLADFDSGIDFHRLTAAQIFGKNPEDITSEERTLAKSINFSIAYLSSAYGLAQRLKIDIKDAQKFIEKWFANRKEVWTFIKILEKRYEDAIEGKTVTYCNIWGRLRHVIRVPLYYEKNGKRRKNPEYGHIIREIVNFYPQSTVADTLAIGIIRLYKKLKEKDLLDYVKFLLTIHDAILLEVKKEKVDIICDIIKESLEITVPFYYNPIKIPVDFTIDKMWKKE